MDGSPGCYLRALCRVCDYGGSGWISRAALRYHFVRLQHYCAMVARQLGFSFCVLVSAVIALPEGFPSRDSPSARYPAAPPLPDFPRPPLSGVAGGGVGRWGLECAAGTRSEILLGAGFLGLRACEFGDAGIYLFGPRAARHYGDHGGVSLVSPCAQEVCRRCIRRMVWLQSGLLTPRGCDWISTAHPARPRRGRRAGWGGRPCRGVGGCNPGPHQVDSVKQGLQPDESTL